MPSEPRSANAGPQIAGVAGILVGGQSSRMGGTPKGLLTTADGTTLIERWRRLFADLGVEAVLIGSGDAYAGLGLVQIPDAAMGVGPLGGVIALLEYAAHAGRDTALAVACDMPFVSPKLVARLFAESASAPATAPRRGTLWEPLCASYRGPLPLEVARRRLASGSHGLQGLLDELGAEALPLNEEELRELRDWDCPADLGR